MPPVVAMLSPAALPMLGSVYGIAQPPCGKPPRVSSSGRPGPWITPSSVMLRNTTTLLIWISFLKAKRLMELDASCQIQLLPETDMPGEARFRRPRVFQRFADPMGGHWNRIHKER